jgi:hypothetical protein
MCSLYVPCIFPIYSLYVECLNTWRTPFGKPIYVGYVTYYQFNKPRIRLSSWLAMCLGISEVRGSILDSVPF